MSSSRKGRGIWVGLLILGILLIPLAPVGVVFSFYSPGHFWQAGRLQEAVTIAVIGSAPGGTLFWYFLQLLFHRGAMSMLAAPPLANAFLAIKLLGYFLIIYSSIRLARSGTSNTK